MIAGHWLGMVPPQYIFSERRFKGVAIDPPNFKPGSWTGAGKAIFHHAGNEFLLTSRPRVAEGNKRGYQANIYRSDDGCTNFSLITSLSKELVQDIAGIDIHSIEGTQLLKDPLTGSWHFYLSVDVGKEFVWGGLKWETLLLVAPDLTGPWESRGIVLSTGSMGDHDAMQARDGTIDIIDGRYHCIYKAKDKEGTRRPGYATSNDGIKWNKHGVLSVDGVDEKVFLSGSLFAGATGPMFIGTCMAHEIDPNVEHEAADEHGVRHGQSLVTSYAAILDHRGGNLETVFQARWEPSSPYEFTLHPLLGYSTSIHDPIRNRILFYVEAIDGIHTVKTGLNHTVERVLVYETML